jgi:hypothetical protein
MNDLGKKVKPNLSPPLKKGDPNLSPPLKKGDLGGFFKDGLYKHLTTWVSFGVGTDMERISGIYLYEFPFPRRAWE